MSQYNGEQAQAERASAFFRSLQEKICSSLATIDGTGKFLEQLWDRSGGGGGRSRLLENGRTFEKAGVNYSAVHGTLPEKLKSSLNASNSEFYATGISLVVHPNTPFVPIIHLNLRYFELEEGSKWFGGGIDLTPHYVNVHQAKVFHEELHRICYRHNTTYYDQFKKWADDYFYIPHRSETRGIGGIFFDRLIADSTEHFEKIFSFVMDLGESFVRIYEPMITAGIDVEFSAENREWQLHRRSRYVEFNLVYDTGTRFGLETNGRTESILMSLPPLVSWSGNVSSGDFEKKTTGYLVKGIDWINA